MVDSVALTQMDEKEHETTYSPSNFEKEVPLPEQLKSWFDGWPERRNLWNKQSEEAEKKFHRAFSCCKHDFDNLVALSGSDT